MSIDHESKCDSCDQPATHAARDVYQDLLSLYSPEPWPYQKIYSPGIWKYGCDEHKVEGGYIE